MRTKVSLLTAFTLLLMSITQGSVAAERVYKWTDKDGGVHYGQQPPASARAEAIKVQKGYSTPAEDDTPAPTPAENTATQQQEYCEAAKKNLEILAGSGQVTRKDDKGESRVMTPEERQAEIERTQKARDFYCPPASEPSPTPQ